MPIARSIPLLIAAALPMAACAPTGAAPSPSAAVDRPCFFPSQVTNFRFADSETLYVRSTRRDVYRLATTGCLDGTASLSIAVVPVRGTARLCAGDQANIVLSQNTIGANPCRAIVQGRLTEDELAALPDRDRP